jgi:IS4 transposase
MLLPRKTFYTPSFDNLRMPLISILAHVPELRSRGNRPLQMNFEDQLNALIFFHLEEHTSGRHLVQTLQEDDFARNNVAPADGISKSSFFEAVNERGFEQFMYVFQELQKQAVKVLPKQFAELGDLVAIDGSLIDAVLSMAWADYRKNSKKAKLHLGFNINHSTPQKLFLTNGNEAERPFVEQILEPGQTGIMDRGYQNHNNFDQLQHQGMHFVCRIKGNTTKTCLKKLPVKKDSIIFYDAIVLLGQESINKTQKELRLVGYSVGSKKYWVATDRFDLTAEQIARIYELRWNIEKFFAWWKRHLRVYHLITRSKHGLMVQILSGLITYLLLAIYCHKQHGEKVSIKRVRELRTKIINETRELSAEKPDQNFLSPNSFGLQQHAST